MADPQPTPPPLEPKADPAPSAPACGHKIPPVWRFRAAGLVLRAALQVILWLVGKDFVAQFLVKCTMVVLYATGENREVVKTMMGKEIDETYASQGYGAA